MIRLLFLFLTFLGICISSVWANSDLTSPLFTLELKPMDPVNDTYVNPDAQGIGALYFILGKVADILLFIIPILGGISFMVAGYYYILSSGDSEKATQGKTIIKWNLVAIAVAFLSYSLVKMILFIVDL